MIFNSIEFFVFLMVIGSLYWRLTGRARLVLLFAGSYLFYGWWDYRFLALIAISTVADFLIGRAIHQATAQRRRKALLWTSIGINLGILGLFKYWNFFTDGTIDLLETVGLNASTPTLDVILPVGISFYTFQTISYSFDIYRRRIEPTRDPLVFAVYVAYFPQLVAGPIERAHALLPQIQSLPTTLLPAQFRSGVTLIGLGLMKKVIIADTMANVANTYFDSPEGVGTAGAVAGMLAFAMQIYGDFSGYTDIARGTSRLLGIELKHNFRQPYLSRNITEFWQRWHISLSDWLRDYLYIPLGGNRSGARRTYINLMLTMLLGGLWHGSSWAFVAWGAFHGSLLALHRAWRPESGARAALPSRREWGHVATTFGLVCLGWVVFRATSLSAAGELLRELLRPEFSRGTLQDLAVVLVFVAAVLVLDVIERIGPPRLRRVEIPPAMAGALAGLLLLGIVISSSDTSAPFIYFQF